MNSKEASHTHDCRDCGKEWACSFGPEATCEKASESCYKCEDALEFALVAQLQTLTQGT